GLAFGFELFALLFEHRSPAQLDLIAFERQDLDQDLVAFLQLVTHLFDARFGDLADVQQAVSAREDLDKRAEIDQPHNLAQIRLTDFGRGRDIGDDLQRFPRRSLVGRRDMHRAVVFHIDLDAGLLDDAADDFASRSNHLADLVLRNVQGVDARRVLRHLWSRRGQGLRHLIEYEETPAAGLLHRL